MLLQVNGNVEKLLEKGSLVAFGVTFPKTGASMMALEMNETRWWLRPDMATLKVGLCTYMLDVTQPGSQQPTFFCITFADDTLPEVRSCITVLGLMGPMGMPYMLVFLAALDHIGHFQCRAP